MSYPPRKYTYLLKPALAHSFCLPHKPVSSNRSLHTPASRIHLFPQTGPCTLLPSSWFLLARSRSQAREWQANGNWAITLPLNLWSLYNCHPDWQLWSWAPDGARHQDGLTDWPSVVKWLWLWLWLWQLILIRPFKWLDCRSSCSYCK
jgi:hypothetical protein